MKSRSFLTSKNGLLYAGFTLCLLMIVGCANIPAQNQTVQNQEVNTASENEVGQNQEPKAVSKEESQDIALGFVRNSPTFSFDGIENTPKLISSQGEEGTSRWEFEYEFQSRQAGYGDRTGLMLAQVITDHRAQIVVEQGEVIQAVLDGQWDMLRQGMIE